MLCSCHYLLSLLLLVIGVALFAAAGDDTFGGGFTALYFSFSDDDFW
jgi:hypothetical protein